MWYWTGPRGIGLDGAIVGDLNAHNPLLQFSPAQPTASTLPSEDAPLLLPPAVPVNRKPALTDYEPSRFFRGARPGFVFQLGDLGLGYYRDVMAEGEAQEADAAMNAAAAGDSPQAVATAQIMPVAAAPQFDVYSNMPYDGRVRPSDKKAVANPLAGLAGQGVDQEATGINAAAFELKPERQPGTSRETEASKSAPEGNAGGGTDPAGNRQPCNAVHSSPKAQAQPSASIDDAALITPPDQVHRPVNAQEQHDRPENNTAAPPRHYWGQALQFLDRAAEVTPGKKLTLLAKRDSNHVRFTLRVGPLHHPPWILLA